MSHVQEVPTQERIWEHSRFEGRRVGHPDSPAEEARLRWWGVNYAAYASADDAKWLRNKVLPACPLRVFGPVLDRFFFDPNLGQYTQTEAQVYACLRWFLTANPTASELILTENMALCRSRMVGAELFSGTPYAFTVSELPTERAE